MTPMDFHLMAQMDSRDLDSHCPMWTPGWSLWRPLSVLLRLLLPVDSICLGLASIALRWNSLSFPSGTWNTALFSQPSGQEKRIHGCPFQDTGCSSLLTSPGSRSHGPSSLLCSYKVVPVVRVYLWSLCGWQGYSGFLINCCETALQDRFCICPEISLIILHTLLLGLLVRETHLNLNLSWGQGWKPNWKQSPACHYGANTTLFLFLDEDFGVRIGRGLVRTGGSGSLCHAWTGHLSLLVPQKWPWPWANVTLI